jgi:hypothetical protein
MAEKLPVVVSNRKLPVMVPPPWDARTGAASVHSITLAAATEPREAAQVTATAAIPSRKFRNEGIMHFPCRLQWK